MMEKLQLTEEKKELLKKTAGVVRALTLDAIEKAQSGHPGLPLGCADAASLIYSELMNHNPKHPEWTARDRFVLSGGHGSMLLYALLHLSGYDISMDDLKDFRQLGSKTPGHPEYLETPGVEATTGPLGQGIAIAVGMAVAQKHQAASYEGIYDNCVIALAGDGCIMEGVVQEAISLAGSLKLDNLILFYDSNQKTIDGSADITFTEDVCARFEACGWDTYDCDGYDYDAMADAFANAKNNGSRPSLIKIETLIGKGAPNFEDKAKAHSGAMGPEEIALLKDQAGLPTGKSFYVPEEITEFFVEKQKEWVASYDSWMKEHREEEREQLGKQIVIDEDELKKIVSSVAPSDQVESRTTFGTFLDVIQQQNSTFFGGSADLTDPCLKGMTHFNVFKEGNRSGNFIYYGIREHGMAGISNGISLYSGYRAYCATFLSFVDYLRPALRLSALMKLPVIYILAYDSVLNGEDGPTHQPIEQLPSIRCMPNVVVIRPADAQEGAICALMAITENNNPIVCVTTRQKLNCFEKQDSNWIEQMKQNGAYIVKDSELIPDYTIVATGSEVNTVIEAVDRLDNVAKIRIVSMPCREYFLRSDKNVQDSIVDPSSDVIVVEAASEQGWSELSDKKVTFIGITDFGASAPGPVIAKARNIDVDGVHARLQRRMSV